MYVVGATVSVLLFFALMLPLLRLLLSLSPEKTNTS